MTPLILLYGICIVIMWFVTNYQMKPRYIGDIIMNTLLSIMFPMYILFYLIVIIAELIDNIWYIEI